MAGLPFVAAAAVVAVVAPGVFVDKVALEVATGAAEALRVEGALADCTKPNPPTAMTTAMPKSAKPWVKWVR